MWTGLVPYPDKDDGRVAVVISRGKKPAYPEHAPPGTDRIWRVFEECWKKPENRPGMDAVVAKLAEL